MGRLRILCGTWNVNAQTPEGVSLATWLCTARAPPDLVAVSCQEIVPLSDVTHYLQTKSSEDAASAWARACVACLEKGYANACYHVVAVSHLVGVMTCVLAKAEHMDSVSEVMVGYFSVGRFSVLGNKGAVAVRFRLRTGARRHSTLCFVGSHLSAHQEEVRKRNADFSAIMGGMTFHAVSSELSKQFASRAVLPLEQIVGVQRQPSRRSRDFGDRAELLAGAEGRTLGVGGISNHDLVFWFGDLNYRVDVPWADAVESIRRREGSRLLERCQLGAERRAGRAFEDFQEGMICFDPTYKFVKGTNRYETLADAEAKGRKPRIPAWCDRVLWKQRDRDRSTVAQLSAYYSCPEFTISDHKPVAAAFVLPFVELSPRRDRALSDASGSSLHSHSPLRSPRSPRSSRSSAPEPSPEPAAGYDLLQSVCATCDYRAASAEELSFREGDLLEVLPENKLPMFDGWLLGRHTGRGAVGYFRADMVTPLGAVKASRKSTHSRTPALKATALRFHRKQVEKQQERQREEEARAPQARSSVLRRLADSLARQAKSLARGRSWSDDFLATTALGEHVAKEDYVAREADELSIQRGDLFDVVSGYPSGGSEWWVCRSLATGEQGLVPSALLEPKQ